jgi:hypothetical protein
MDWGWDIGNEFGTRTAQKGLRHHHRRCCVFMQFLGGLWSQIMPLCDQEVAPYAAQRNRGFGGKNAARQIATISLDSASLHQGYGAGVLGKIARRDARSP